MGFQMGNDIGFERSKTIWWTCKNAVPKGRRGCSWSRRFVPVDGWIALPPRSRVRGSYRVIACPLYEEDDE